MSYIVLNALPILIATAASLVFGFLWLRLLGGEAVAARPSPGFAVAAFVAEFWLASILAGALILAPPQAGQWTMAVMTPIVIWVGFVLPAFLVTLLYRGLGGGAILIDCGLWLGSMVIQAVVLHAIGLVPPPQG